MKINSGSFWSRYSLAGLHAGVTAINTIEQIHFSL
jgi:hypothetical protein